jgi:hypothetical protein
MAAEILDPITSGGIGAGGGTLIGALIAKLFVNKTEKEIEAIKTQMAANEKSDAARDVDIAILKVNHADIKDKLNSIDNRLEKIMDKLGK